MAQVTLREYLQEIEDTLSAGQSDDAVNKCQHVLAQFPESLEVQRLLGEVYLARGQIEDAQQALDWILTNDPENVIAYCDRALISERLSDFDTALDCYQQAYELSRGNHDIRQQFNMLSAKAGQQGFMFSRAGLARLYMRGGLLPQAIQEWDAVLFVSPDRLDARTGLLEAYWREGLYDEAEQLALQTLQDVPGCIKALLILAHVTAPKNMQQAKEYVQRAELLDPDLLMAQELFEDMVMNQAGHPFLKLLKKAPTMLDSSQAFAQSVSIPVSAEPVFASVSASQEASSVPDVPIYEMPTSVNIFEWSKLDAWDGSVETPAKSEANEQPISEVPTVPTWSHDIFSSSDAWTLPVQPQQVQESQKQETPSPSEQNLENSHFDVQSDESATPTLQEDQKRNNSGQLAGLSADESWRDGYEMRQADITEPSWMSNGQEEPVGASPAWLNMLTQDELRSQPQLSDTTPSPIEEPEQEQPSIETPVLPVHQQPMNTTPADATSDTSWRDVLQASLNTTTDEEPFFFGPEWLKSLGAAEIGSEVQEQPAQAPIVSQTQSEVASSSLESVQAFSAESESPLYETHEQSEPGNASLEESAFDTSAESNTLSAEPQHVEPSEQTIIHTLEDLEQNLLSEGFVPLEPNSLSAIAQAQEISSDESHIADLYSPKEEMQEEEHSHSTLSSALEQLGNLATPHTQSAYQAPEPFMPAAQQMSTQPSEDSFWASDLRTVPALPQEPLLTLPNYADAFPKPVFEPTQEPARVDVPIAPTARFDPFFENELETTMKRPAIRLQAMKEPQSPMSATPYQITGKGYGSESTFGGGKDGAQRLQERLVKGYQHQLVGDYDEAMQEYRIIIKSAPELLDEVVSNVRALLKIAPKYSAGYRVLGDAYMRQGEYLQAMEAYNKALTMAKKAKV